jgi:putative transcriptional regulator
MSLNRDKLLEHIRKMLTDCGFAVSDPISLKSIAFDLVARRDDELLVLKVLQNIDAFNKDDAGQMRTLADALDAKAAVIGLRSSSNKLDEGIVYSRFGLPIMSMGTLEEFLKEGVPPFVFAAPGGLYVKIDSDLLKQIRTQRNISLGTLAEIAGVSRKAIQMYEEGMGAVIEVAMKIEEFLNEPLVMPLNPFEAISSDEKIMLLTGVERYGPMLEKKADAVASVSRVVERRAVIITDKDARMKSVHEMPLMSRRELAGAEDRKTILDIIRERSKEGG